MTLEHAAYIAEIVTAGLAILGFICAPKQVMTFLKNHWKVLGSLFAIAVGCICSLHGWLSWLSIRICMPVWFLMLIGFIVCGLAIGFSWLANRLSQEHDRQGAAASDPSNYITDNIFGIQWIWKFFRNEIAGESLAAFCPTKGCMKRLEMRKNINCYGVTVAFVCNRCGFLRDFDRDWEHVRWEALMEIERRIRTGEFQERTN